MVNYLESTPLYTLHSLRYIKEKDLRPDLRLVVEYVHDTLLKKDEYYIDAYLSEIFLNELTRVSSGAIKVYSPNHIVYYSSKTKSWHQVPSQSKLESWWSIKQILSEE